MIGSKTRQEFGPPGSGQKLLRHLDDRRYRKSSSYGLKTYRFTDNVCSILKKIARNMDNWQFLYLSWTVSNTSPYI